MEQVLYGDILFLINFTMDFLTLYISASILKRKASVIRLCLSSSVGALYGVAACFINGTVLFDIVLNLAVSFLMCYIAFDRRILPCCALFYGVGCLIGGAMTAFFGILGGYEDPHHSYAEGGNRMSASEIPLGWMAAVAACIGIAAIAGGQYAKRERNIAVTLKIETETASAELDGIADSGNLLCDPTSGRAVIILKKSVFLSLIPDNIKSFYESNDPSQLVSIDPKYAKSIRLIPSSSVGGNRLLLSFIPKKVIVDGIERSTVIAMGDEDGYNGRSALVPFF